MIIYNNNKLSFKNDLVEKFGVMVTNIIINKYYFFIRFT